MSEDDAEMARLLELDKLVRKFETSVDALVDLDLLVLAQTNPLRAMWLRDQIDAIRAERDEDDEDVADHA